MTIEQCSQVQRIEAAEKRVDTLFDLLKQMENKFDAKLDLILMQMSKLAVLEVNHQNHGNEMNRIANEISTLKAAVTDINNFRHRTEGMAKMAWLIWGALGGTVGFLLIKVMFP